MKAPFIISPAVHQHKRQILQTKNRCKEYKHELHNVFHSHKYTAYYVYDKVMTSAKIITSIHNCITTTHTGNYFEMTSIFKNTTD